MVKIKKILDRYFYIYYIFLEKYGTFGGSGIGVIGFFSGLLMFIGTACFLRLKIGFIHPILFIVIVNSIPFLLLYRLFMYKKKWILIIENNKDKVIKWYEILFSSLFVILLFVTFVILLPNDWETYN